MLISGRVRFIVRIRFNVWFLSGYHCRQRVVSEDRGVAPEVLLLMADRHRSVGEWLS